MEGILEFAKIVKQSGILGFALGQAEVIQHVEEDNLLEQLLSKEGVWKDFARGFVSGRVQVQSKEWAEQKILDVGKQWSPEQRGDFLSCLLANVRTWDLAASFDRDTERSYWRTISPYDVNSENLERAISKLLEYHRPYTSALLLWLNIKKKNPQLPNLILEVLSRALEISPHDDLVKISIGHIIGGLFDHLYAVPEIDETRVALLEWSLLPILGRLSLNRKHCTSILPMTLLFSQRWLALFIVQKEKNHGKPPKVKDTVLN